MRSRAYIRTGLHDDESPVNPMLQDVSNKPRSMLDLVRNEQQCSEAVSIFKYLDRYEDRPRPQAGEVSC